MIIALMLIGLALLTFTIVGDWDPEAGAFGLFVFAVSAVLTLCSYVGHSRDVGIIAEQDRVIAVYEENVMTLTKSLADLNPRGVAVVNADTPVAALVQAIAEGTGKLAEAKEAKAQAYVSIAQRRAGPFWFVAALD